VGKCVVTQCTGKLAKCLTSPKCAANLVCINTCTGRADESECQIRCGDLFENDVVGEFNACAVSQKKCVPQRGDDGAWPVPPEASYVKAFDTRVFDGRWYISAGLNPVFDTFDCQVHFFTAPTPKTLYGKLNWRIAEPDGEFFTKDTIQRFVEDEKQPGILYNHDNEYLHYQDDWYILDYEAGKGNDDSDAFVLVYYRGRNDAWDGYGGAVVYSTSPELKKEYVPELTEIAKKVGVKFSDFVVTDNTCKAQAPLKVTAVKDLDTLSDDVVAIEKEIVRDEKALFSFVGKEARTVAREVGKDARLFEKEIEKDVKVIEKDLGLVSVGKVQVIRGASDAVDLPTTPLTGKAKAEQAKATRLVNKVEANIGRIQDQ